MCSYELLLLNADTHGVVILRYFSFEYTIYTVHVYNYTEEGVEIASRCGIGSPCVGVVGGELRTFTDWRSKIHHRTPK